MEIEQQEAFIKNKNHKKYHAWCKGVDEMYLLYEDGFATLIEEVTCHHYKIHLSSGQVMSYYPMNRLLFPVFSFKGITVGDLRKTIKSLLK